MNNLSKVVLQGIALSMILGGAALAADPRELTWDDLMPEGQILEPPDPNSLNHDEMLIGDNWEESSFEEAFSTPAYPTGVVEELDGTLVKVPGFIVPLELTGGARVKEFLLVPYFGACIHYPPPPPNQIAYVMPEVPLKLEMTRVPIWVTGVIKTEFKNSGMGAAGYTMIAQEVEGIPCRNENQKGQTMNSGTSAFVTGALLLGLSSS